MSKYKEIVHMIADELQLASDDAYFTKYHIIFLIDKMRMFLLKKNYLDLNKEIPQSSYQTICLTLTPVNSIDGVNCGDTFLKSEQEIPALSTLATPKIYVSDILQGEVTYVPKERLPFVGYNKYLRNIIYAALGSDNRLYLKSNNPQMEYLEELKLTGIFEDSEAANSPELSCNGNSDDNCDIMEKDFPLEDALVPMLIELVVKELSTAIYRPSDVTNDAEDDLANKMTGNQATNGRAYTNRRRRNYDDAE